MASNLDFTTSIADAASTIVDYFKNKGGIAYINVLANISKSCDCVGARALPPKVKDIGILASTDPVAIDKACYDLIEKENSDGAKDWINHAKMGLNTLNVAVDHKLGTLDYNFIDIDIDIDKDKDGNHSQTSQKGKLNHEVGKQLNQNSEKKSNLNIILFFLFLFVLFLIILIVYSLLKDRKKGNLIKNEEISKSGPVELDK